MVSVTYFNKQRNEVTMLKELKELLLIIFSQDNDNIDTIKT